MKKKKRILYLSLALDTAIRTMKGNYHMRQSKKDLIRRLEGIQVIYGEEIKRKELRSDKA